MSFEEYLRHIKMRQNMERADAKAFLSLMLDDTSLTDETIADALTALTKKTVTAEEICGFVDAMRERMVRVPYSGPAIDTCGTGGDQQGTFNISTAAAILLAAGNVNVAKHGNRAATGKCGSADVLEALGVPVDLSPDAAAQALSSHGFVFLFAPLYHPSLKRLSQIRRQLGFPTVFNLLGPLLNPAGVKRQIIGTFSLANAELLAAVMAQMNYDHAIVLTSQDGLDEASLSAPVNIFEIKQSIVVRKSLKASDYRLKPAPLSSLAGDDATRNASIITDVLQPAVDLSAPQRVVVLNAGLGFYVSGQESSVELGVERAKIILASGAAGAKLKEFQGSR
ncbi:MAG TPA: anthranilate phosphoribosyltransferase [Candidatus Dormibacteraeota bacterium]|nr:anthranilate phosphoribosyltransferase [Candidatus Dormibacteraeota bacterium]